VDETGKLHDWAATATPVEPSELEELLLTFMTFTAVILTVASAFSFGIFLGYMMICGLLRLMDRRPVTKAPVHVEAHAASSGD
jgi:hypothetical protein